MTCGIYVRSKPNLIYAGSMNGDARAIYARYADGTMYFRCPDVGKHLFMIANAMLKPSYISLESALSVYGLIPETVYGITSVTSAHTARFDTDLGSFSYRHIKQELMFGYYVRTVGDDPCDMADMEKAVLDYLYFHHDMKEDSDFAGWRFNSHEFKARADMEKFKRYEAAFHSKELSKRVLAFMSYINHA